MKKIMFIMALVLVAVSCKKDPDLTPKGKSLSAAPLALSFGQAGGTLDFAVVALNVEFEVTPSDDWIGCVRNSAPEAGGAIRIDVTVGENTGDPRAGSITLSGDGVEDVVVVVTQAAPEVVVSDIIWDGSQAVLMNLKGGVKTASYHFSETYDVEDTLFEFDPDGYVTSFLHTKYDDSQVPVTVAYDAGKRITGITGSGAEDFLISFEYGDHGQYISTEEVFYTISNNQVVSDMLWMPRFVKNLAKITFTDSKSPSDNMTLTYTVDGDSGSLRLTGSDGTVTEDFHMLTFDDGFVKTVTFDFYGAQAVVTYTVDPETGHIVKREQTDSWGAMVREYNGDTINSMKSLDDGWGVFHYSYNEDLDLVEVKDGDTVAKTINYEYDQQRNWTGMTIDSGEPVARTVTYW